MFFVKCVFVICITAALCTACFADVVEFVNGDKISGKVVTMADGKVEIQSAMAGKVVVDIKNVKAITTDEAVEVQTTAGQISKQQLTAVNAEGVTANPGLVDLAEIEAINPPAKQKPKWTGEVVGGLTSTHGNTTADTYSLSGKIAKETEKYRSFISGDYFSSDKVNDDTGQSETIEQWLKARAKYDRFLGEKKYVYFDSRYETDDIANLDRRVILGSGLGWQWIKSAKMNFSTELGGAWQYEKYGNDTGSENNVKLQAGYLFDKVITDKINFLNELTFYPAFEDMSDYYLTSTAELRAKITGNMFTNFKVIFDYDTTPAIGSGKTDVKYLLGVGWSIK